jgi:hypothetical protein
MRTSTIPGVLGRPTRRENCGTVMRVLMAIASPSLVGSADAIFQPQPRGVIADNPVVE